MELSSDGQNWNEIQTETEGVAGDTTISLNGAKVNYLKMQ